MTLYIVTADTHKGDYGVEIELLCVTPDEEYVQEITEDAEKQGWVVNTIIVSEQDLSKKLQIYLGGYIE